MNVTIRLFDAHNIAQLPWPPTENGVYARSYLCPLIEQGPVSFISNVTTQYMALLIDEQIVLPISLNEHDYANSYVCSPYTHYVSYAKEELVLLKQPWLRRLFALTLDMLGLLGKLCQMNRVVHINNWLFSTNLYPNLTPEQLIAVVAFVQEKFPRHALIFRSLNVLMHSTFIAALREIGSTLIASRQIYVVHPADPSALNAKARWLLKRDYALIARYGYTLAANADLHKEDVARIVKLYNMLYLDKYSRYNPMFTEKFLSQAWRERTLELVAIQKDGRIDAALGYFVRNGIMTTPLFGYDTTLPQELGLYRMLSSVLFRIAQERNLCLHESSGAAQFKRNRGAVGEIEYSAVYARHLPLYRRIYWALLALLLDKIGVPYIKKHKLYSKLSYARASTNPHTADAPAAKSGSAHASSVAAVVQTSSIISRVRPLMLFRAEGAH